MVEVTILADNTVATPIPSGLRGEWGFSATVDGVLFDTGKSDVAFHNAQLLDVPTNFEQIVLSHAHFDHTGGLRHFLGSNSTPTVFAHPEIWTARYSTVAPGGIVRTHPVHTGIPFTRDVIESQAEIREHDRPVEVVDGIFALGEIPRPHVETTSGHIMRDGELVADSNVDDQALAIRTTGGTALVVGCCHSGLENSIEYAEEICEEPVRYIVGGTHLVDLDEEAIHGIADRLGGTIELFAGTHCTGFRAQSILEERLPEAFRFVGVGSTIDLPPVRR